MKNEAEILLVDDDPDIVDAMGIILEAKGYHIRKASNGNEAKAALKEKLPDIMVLDVMMSTDTEGFDLAYELKDNPDFKNLPIIMLSAFMEKVRQEGPGPFDFIVGEQWPTHWFFEKPVDPEKFVAKIEEILSSKA